MIDRFFTTTVTVERQTYTGNISTSAAAGTFLGHIQQISQEELAKLASGVTLTHRVWCALGTDVAIGDELTVDSWTYSVKAIQRNGIGANQHLDVLVEKDYELSA